MISLKFDWPNLVPINKTATSSPVSLQLASIVVVEREGGGSVSSVNGQTGDIVLAANDVGADIAGSALAVSDALQPQITTNTDAVAMLVALLSALQASKADLTYVNDQIANLVNSDAQTLATIQAITDALAESEDLLEALDQTVANRVRFDVATQGLTALQKYNARTNIGAEEIGTAAQLISQITAASIGAVTANQLATVATTGSYNDLINKPNITGTLLTGLTTATAAAISATDSIISALAKLQASVDTKADAANTLLLLGNKQNKLPTDGTAGQFLAHDLTFKTPVGGGGGSATPSNFGCGYQGFLPPVGNYVDNGILNTPYSSTYHNVIANGEMTLPFMFSKDTPIDQIGMITRPQANAGGYRFAIYDSLASGAPDKVIYVSAQINVTSSNDSYCAASVSYTFEAGKMYWFRFSVNTNNLLFRCLGVGNNLSFGNSGYFNSNSPTSERGNTLIHNGYFNPTVGSKYSSGNPITVYDIFNSTLIPRIVMRRA